VTIDPHHRLMRSSHRKFSWFKVLEQDYT